MNFSMYSSFSKLVIEKGIEYAAKTAIRIGTTSVEFITDASSEKKQAVDSVAEAKKIRAVLEQYSLPVSCYSVYINVWDNPFANEQLKKYVDVAAAIGAPFLHHTLLPWLELPEDAPTLEDGIKRACDVAIEVANYAREKGIFCIYEEQGRYLNGVKNFGIFFDCVKAKCNNVGICADLGNILFENESPEEFIQKYAKDILHVHVKDYIRKEVTISPGRYWLHAKGNVYLRDTMIGSGCVDFEACLELLKNIGYKGAYSLENSHPEPFEEGVFQAMEYLTRIMKSFSLTN